MKKRNLTQAQLAEAVRVRQSAVNKWLNKGVVPKGESLTRLAKLFELSVDDLLGLPNHQALREHFNISEKIADYLGKNEKEREDLFQKMAAFSPSQKSALLKSEVPRDWGGPYYGTSDEAPIVSPVAAGDSRAWEDAGHTAPKIKVNCKDPNCYCVEVWGDSMSPIYLPGDILVISPNIQVAANDLVVFKTENDEPFFKKYLGERTGTHRFASLNPNYPVMEFKRGILKMHPVHSVIRPLKGKLY